MLVCSLRNDELKNIGIVILISTSNKIINLSNYRILKNVYPLIFHISKAWHHLDHINTNAKHHGVQVMQYDHNVSK